jgi:hypothetical protein
MKNTLWLIAGGLGLLGIIYYFKTRQTVKPGATTPAVTGTAASTTGTAKTPDPFWAGWVRNSGKVDNATTDNIIAATNAAPAAWTTIKGLFGSGAKNPAGGAGASGNVNAATSGSGAGQPTSTTPNVVRPTPSSSADNSSQSDSYISGSDDDTAADTDPNGSFGSDDPNSENWGDTSGID